MMISGHRATEMTARVLLAGWHGRDAQGGVGQREFQAP
jgi:hypothetical protein